MDKRPQSFSMSQEGKAYVGDFSCDDLANEYGTPLYVLDQKTIEKNCQAFLEPLNVHYPNSKVLYAGKANLTVGIAQLMMNLGMNIDVSSGGELYTAKKAGVPASKIYFHGNNKGLDELAMAIDYCVCVIVDNFQELDNIISICESENKSCRISVRLKPEIDAHTHEYIRTGQLDSKFGIERKDLAAFINRCKEQSSIELVGIHSHIGSQIFDKEPYLELIDILVPLLKSIRDDHGIEIQELNCGGGMGIYYTSEDSPIEIAPFIRSFAATLKDACEKQGIEEPTLLFEPGRSIIGPAGLTLYKVGAVKEIENVKRYVFINGGMADNPRPIMYQAKYDVALTQQRDGEQKEYAIAGKFCESGDILAEGVSLGPCEVGDHLAFFATGAYNYSMASNYNRNCRPAMILVNQDKVQELVKRETYDDLIRLDQELD